jgi:cellulose synthase/poly-beta-1,6-N-acetylglucosamine synthase-like glycosyltransferase
MKARTIRRLSLALLAWSQIGYPLALWLLRRAAGSRTAIGGGDELPRVSLVIAAHNEASVIENKVRNALALDYPADKLELIVTDDGSTDDTAALADAAGASFVLRNGRGGKIRAQDAAVRRATGDVIAFSDANALWEPGALRELVAPFADSAVGFVCGQVRFVNPDGGSNQEGLYWRYEMGLRELESDLSSITAGNGAIYAVRRSAYVEVDPVMGHDLKLPFTLVRAGWRCVYAPSACATERMVPSIEGEAARKRRMMSHAWSIVLRGGLLDPRGWPPLYALMMISHRWLRYAAPFLHAIAFVTGAWRAHAALAALAAAGRSAGRPGLVARYYVATQTSIALGLADHLVEGTAAEWEQPEGTREGIDA